MRIDGNNSAFDPAAMRQEMFKKTDSDSNGKVTKDELKTMLAQAPAGGSAAPDIDEIFSQIDTNGDGSIDEDENEAFGKSMDAGRPDPSTLAASIFKTADQDGDGSITKDELMASVPGADDKASFFDDLFASADSDGDGSISQSDLESLLSERINPTLTYDKDGERTTFPAQPRYSDMA